MARRSTSSFTMRRMRAARRTGYSSDYARCRFAVMNPELTATLNEWQTMSGCTDIIMHTLERYFYSSDTAEPESLLTDNIAEGLIKAVIKSSHVLKKEPQNYEARAQVMWASSLS